MVGEYRRAFGFGGAIDSKSDRAIRCLHRVSLQKNGHHQGGVRLRGKKGWRRMPTKSHKSRGFGVGRGKERRQAQRIKNRISKNLVLVDKKVENDSESGKEP